MNKTIPLLSESIRKRVGIWLQSLVLDPANPLEVVIRDHEPAKTNEQRRLFHAVCRDIGRELGETPARIKHAIKVEYFGQESYQLGGKTYTRVQSSEEPGKREYSELIEHALRWGAEHGVYVEVAA
jgi:hypothetical protein